jgi:diadenosine tetraphosphate (Ap4A) HIT family hydrolase
MTTNTILAPEQTANCLFCRSPNRRVLAKNKLGYAYLDGHPVTEGHTLVVPWRHAETYFDLDAAEVSALNDLLCQAREIIVAEDRSVTGFNIGMNCGASAGQSIGHCHIHLIPRRQGDVADPRGGVRSVIPDKRRYD